MHITPLAIKVDPLVGRGDRTAGMHLTEIIHYLELTDRGMPEPQHWEEAAAVGFYFEDAIRVALRDTWFRGTDREIIIPGELEEDGIIGTPDGLERDGDEDVLWEFKATWKSYKKSPPEDIWHYMVQIKGYLYMMRATKARMAVLYLCGIYHPPEPLLIGVELEFTVNELVDNWRMLTTGKANMERLEAAGPWQMRVMT